MTLYDNDGPARPFWKALLIVLKLNAAPEALAELAGKSRAPHALPFDCWPQADDQREPEGGFGDHEAAQACLELWGIDHAGTDELDRRYHDLSRDVSRRTCRRWKRWRPRLERTREPSKIWLNLSCCKRDWWRERVQAVDWTDAGSTASGGRHPMHNPCSEKTTDEHQRNSSEDRGGHHRSHWRDSHAPCPEPRHRPMHFVAQIECQNQGNSIKDRIAVSMINRAEEEGRLQPGWNHL